MPRGQTASGKRSALRVMLSICRQQPARQTPETAGSVGKEGAEVGGAEAPSRLVG